MASKGYVNVLDIHLWATKWGLTLTLVNDWVDYRWHQQFLELMVLSWMRRRYVRVGVSLTYGAVPLLALMYNQSLLVKGDTRGVQLSLLGFSIALRMAPRHFNVQRQLPGAPDVKGVQFIVYNLKKLSPEVLKHAPLTKVARCSLCHVELTMPTDPWPPTPEAFTKVLDTHAATHAAELGRPLKVTKAQDRLP